MTNNKFYVIYTEKTNLKKHMKGFTSKNEVKNFIEIIESYRLIEIINDKGRRVKIK